MTSEKSVAKQFLEEFQQASKNKSSEIDGGNKTPAGDYAIFNTPYIILGLFILVLITGLLAVYLASGNSLMGWETKNIPKAIMWTFNTMQGVLYSALFAAVLFKGIAKLDSHDNKKGWNKIYICSIVLVFIVGEIYFFLVNRILNIQDLYKLLGFSHFEKFSSLSSFLISVIWQSMQMFILSIAAVKLLNTLLNKKIAIYLTSLICIFILAIVWNYMLSPFVPNGPSYMWLLVNVSGMVGIYYLWKVILTYIIRKNLDKN